MIFSKTFSILRNTLPWHSKKTVHLLFCVFQFKLNKGVNFFCRLPEWIRNKKMIQGFRTRLGRECGWKPCMANSKDWRFEDPKGNLTFPTHTVNVIELNCKVVKKWQAPHFYINPPFQVYPPFLAKSFVSPQVTGVGVGVPTMYMLVLYCFTGFEKLRHSM